MKGFSFNQVSQKDYNRFVAAHPSGSFLQSWEWGAWQEQLGNQVHRLAVMDGDKTLLTAQVIQTIIPRFHKNYLYIPYGPLLAPDASAETLNYFLDQLKQKYPNSLFVRLEPKNNLEIKGRPTVHIQPGKTSIVDLTKTPEELQAAMHHKTRYNIKVAQRHGVQIVSELIVTPGHGLHLQESLDLLINTATRQGFKSHGPSYYKKLIDFFALQPESDVTLTVYKALLEQKLLATAIMVDFGTTRTYLFGGTSEEQKNVMAPYLLHWQAMIEAKNTGLTHYDFWGVETASGQTPGFVRFKLGFSGQTITYPGSQDIVWHSTWYTIYNLLRILHRKLS